MADYSLDEPEEISRSIVTVRDQKVMLDSDLAALFEVETKRLNEQVKRNADRFGEKYTFQMTKDEFDALKSLRATSKTGRGGRRYPPRVFTEHGVVMAATVLNSERAIEASKLIVDVFVDVKHRLTPGESSALARLSGEPSLSQHEDAPKALMEGLGPRLHEALNQMLDSVVDQRRQTTVREEAEHLISESIDHLKERLKRQGLENEEVAARASKLLAEAEKEKSVAAKTRAETEALQFQTIVRKLRLLIEANRAVTHSDLDGFLEVLKELGET